jgi:hypothetical protein
MLRLVHPAPAGQGTGPSKRRKGARSRAFSLTPDEGRHLRAALQNLRRDAGTWAALAEMLGVSADGLAHAATQVGKGGAALALRAAKLAGVSVEALLSGSLNAAGRCATCGHRAGDGRVALAAGGAR